LVASEAQSAPEGGGGKSAMFEEPHKVRNLAFLKFYYIISIIK